MQVRLSSTILSSILVLVGLTTSLVHAAPAAQRPTPGSYDSPEAAMLRTIREVVPPEVLQQTPVQLVPLDADTYLVSHPGLVWPVDQQANAQAVVAQYFAAHGPGWGTAVVNGPQGQGVYLTYDPAASGTPQASLLPTVQQLL